MTAAHLMPTTNPPSHLPTSPYPSTTSTYSTPPATTTWAQEMVPEIITCILAEGLDDIAKTVTKANERPVSAGNYILNEVGCRASVVLDNDFWCCCRGCDPKYFLIYASFFGFRRTLSSSILCKVPEFYREQHSCHRVLIWDTYDVEWCAEQRGILRTIYWSYNNCRYKKETVHDLCHQGWYSGIGGILRSGVTIPCKLRQFCVARANIIPQIAV